jgi:phenylpropionate dioxygenase-like ring-hydroxylating dioxygenase large terminal subunit
VRSDLIDPTVTAHNRRGEHTGDREAAMTSAAEGQELTQVGAGTVMGELMRQYWIPAAQSAELVRDGAPIRLMLLGEKLIAFRDTEGRVGVMDHRCPHRCASLFLGRNEEGGIRCIYHGWKYDVAGNCIDMASVPPHQDFKHRSAGHP